MLVQLLVMKDKVCREKQSFAHLQRTKRFSVSHLCIISCPFSSCWKYGTFSLFPLKFQTGHEMLRQKD